MENPLKIFMPCSQQNDIYYVGSDKEQTEIQKWLDNSKCFNSIWFTERGFLTQKGGLIS